jgi:hypothetical protein
MAEVMGEHSHHNPNQTGGDREMGEQPATAARDDSITAITQRTNTRTRKITQTPPQKLKRKPKPSPMPTPLIIL